MPPFVPTRGCPAPTFIIATSGSVPATSAARSSRAGELEQVLVLRVGLVLVGAGDHERGEAEAQRRARVRGTPPQVLDQLDGVARAAGR